VELAHQQASRNHFGHPFGRAWDARLLLELLQAAPALKILVTSRCRLHLQAEDLLHVHGLDCRDCLSDHPDPATPVPAVELFLSGARRIQPGFAAPAAELACIAAICRAVEGLPLANLLAADWAELLRPAQIGARLEAANAGVLDFLHSSNLDLPEQQRSMRAVFDRSWALLPAELRAMLAALSVLNGAFTAEEACSVAGASLSDLRALLDWSLLEQAGAGRYALHGLLRLYAQEKRVGTITTKSL
jgi:predicted ATPase